MKRTDLVVQRAANQRLSTSGFKNAVDVVRWFGAVQAQDFHGGKWALALRMRNATNDAAVEKAYNDGRILRTHLLRPTWHFVAPEDIRWLLQLTGPRIDLRCGPTYRKYELDAATLKRTSKILLRALNGKHLTRTELKSVLNRAGIAADDPVRMAHVLIRAELEGLICSGRRIGKQFTYALLDERLERVPEAKTLSREEALAELTRRYFTSHGPATLADFVWWSGLTAGDARRGIASIESELSSVLVEKTEYHFTRTKVATQRSLSSAYLLPAFDEYNVAYKERQITLGRTNAAFSTADTLGPTVMLGGVIVGRWKLRADQSVAIAAARRLSKSERVAVGEALDRYGAFLGALLTVEHLS